MVWNMKIYHSAIELILKGEALSQPMQHKADHGDGFFGLAETHLND
jgi:hypothetical protein